jgi:hypothetical protein
VVDINFEYHPRRAAVDVGFVPLREDQMLSELHSIPLRFGPLNWLRCMC